MNNIWMSVHGKALAAQMKAVGEHDSNGDLPMFVLASAITLVVLREGSEIVLSMSGMFLSGNSAVQRLAGGALGVAGRVLIGIAM